MYKLSDPVDFRFSWRRVYVSVMEPSIPGWLSFFRKAEIENVAVKLSLWAGKLTSELEKTDSKHIINLLKSGICFIVGAFEHLWSLTCAIRTELPRLAWRILGVAWFIFVLYVFLKSSVLKLRTDCRLGRWILICDRGLNKSKIFE